MAENYRSDTPTLKPVACLSSMLAITERYSMQSIQNITRTTTKGDSFGPRTTSPLHAGELDRRACDHARADAWSLLRVLIDLEEEHADSFDYCDILPCPPVRNNTVSIYLCCIRSLQSLIANAEDCIRSYVLLYNIRSPLAYKSEENAFCDCRVLSFPIWLIGVITLL